MFARVLVASLVLVLASCRSFEITPAVLRTATDAHPERREALARWTAGVELANEFLASEFRLSLPAGRFELDDDGMRFVGSGGEFPLRVVRSTWGDWVVRVGFAAQEREWGFVVGQRCPVNDAWVDHSFFRGVDGELASPFELASLVLHETTHVLHREGTVGFWNGVAYYGEAIFLFRYDTHSGERCANATSEEFAYFATVRDADATHRAAGRERLAAHVAEGPTESCVHAATAAMH